MALISFFFVAQAWSLPYKIDIHAVALKSSGWREELFDPEFQRARDVFIQCGLDVRLARFETSAVDRALVKKYAADDDPDSIAAVATESKNIPRPAVFLLDSFSDSDPTPFSRADFAEHHPPYAPALLDTAWYPLNVISDSYRNSRAASPYSTLAHELVHILTKWGDHNNDAEPNQLTIYRRRNDRLTPEMCARIVANPLVKMSDSGAHLP